MSLLAGGALDQGRARTGLATRAALLASLAWYAPSGPRCGERFHGTPPRDRGYAQPGRRYAPGTSPPPTPLSSPRDPKHSASDNSSQPTPPTVLLPHKSLTPHDAADQHWSDTRKRKNSGLIKSGVKMERATGIEPASEAWEASILPMNYARNSSSRRNRPVDHIVTPDGRATGVAWAWCGSAGGGGRGEWWWRRAERVGRGE